MSFVFSLPHLFHSWRDWELVFQYQGPPACHHSPPWRARCHGHKSLQWAPATDHMPPAMACGQEWPEGQAGSFSSLATWCFSKHLNKKLSLKCSLQKKQQTQSSQKAKCCDSRSDSVYEEESLESAPLLFSFSFPSPSLPPFSVDSSSSLILTKLHSLLLVSCAWMCLGYWKPEICFPLWWKARNCGLPQPSCGIEHWLRKTAFHYSVSREKWERVTGKGDKVLWEIYRCRYFVFIGKSSYVKRGKML